MRCRAALAACFTAALLASCAPLRWDRPGTDRAATESDSRTCRATARQQYLRLTERPLFVPYFRTVRDGDGRVRSIPVVPSRQFGPPIWSPYAPSLALDQRTTLRKDLYDGCMESRGYRLVPDVADAGAPPSADAPALPPSAQ